MVDPLARQQFVRKLGRWGRPNRRQFAWRDEADPFRVLVAEVLLQRSRARTVDIVYQRLFARWPTPEAMSRAHVSTLASVIRPLGLVSRAVTLKSLAARVALMGRVPDSMESLMSLPGVGRYAAAATIAAGGGRLPLVDSVSARVYRRFFGLQPEARSFVDEPLWRLVDEVSPKRAAKEWNWSVLDLASGLCLPQVPRCPECPLSSHCTWARSHAVAAS
jgi:A/G-specific adenine glycosylase